MTVRMRRLLQPDFLIAAIVLALLFAGVHAAGRVVDVKIEAEAVATAIKSAERDARLLVEYWTSIEARIAQLQELAQTVTLAQVAGDQAAVNRDLDRLRLVMQASNSGFVQVAAANTHGDVIWASIEGSNTALAPVNLNDREHIQAILKDRLDKFVGQPVVGKVSGKRTIQFAAAERAVDGTLIGVGVVSFDLTRAEDLARGIIRNDHDAVTLLRRDGKDGTVLARSDGQAIGTKIAGLDMLFASGPNSAIGISHSVSPVDGIRRIVVRQDVPGGSLSVLVGLDETTALHDADAFQARLQHGAYLTCFLLTLLVAAALIVWRQARSTEAMRVRMGSQAARDDLLHEIADQSQDLVAVLDEDLQYIFVNSASRIVAGVEPADAIGKHAREFVVPEARADIRARLDANPQDAGPFRFMLPINHANGEVHWLEFEMSRIGLPEVQGSPRHGWFLIARDVTGRKAAEEAVQRANDDFRTLARSSPGSLYRTELRRDGHHRILYRICNDRMNLGYDEKSWLEPGFVRTIVHPDDMPIYDQFTEKLFHDTDAVAEYRLRHRDGYYIWRRDTATGTDPRGEVSIVSGYALDITANKEQATKLEQAQRMLSLGELASGLGHEIGQPLMAISLAAENAIMDLEQAQPNIAKATDRLDLIANLTSRAGAIIDNMRAFGRKETKTTAWTRPCDSVSDALDTVRGRLVQERIEAVIDVPPTLPSVLVPPLLFQQVLINLIANACDAYRERSDFRPPVRDEEARKVWIVGKAENRHVLLQVKDRAGGIPPDMADRVFEPFFTTKGSERGTGLGLSVCYAIVRQSGGMLSVRNEDGGAIFDISLPLSDRPGDARDSHPGKPLMAPT